MSRPDPEPLRTAARRLVATLMTIPQALADLASLRVRAWAARRARQTKTDDSNQVRGLIETTVEDITAFHRVDGGQAAEAGTPPGE